MIAGPRERILANGAAAEASGCKAQDDCQLALEGITFQYGRQSSAGVLQGIDLEVQAGEFVTLLGPSGCGKTTLLRIVAGLLRPTSGRVLLDGRDISNSPPERRPLNMVFQHLALFPHLNVADNVAFGLRFMDVPRSERRERVLELLELVGLNGYEARRVHEISGGQRQRVALARALITSPRILLLDEPLGALDYGIRRELQRELKNLQRKVGITFLFVTHDQTEAMSMSDRIVLMQAGSVVQDATPFETYTNPTTHFAATFVGDANAFEGVVTRETQGSCYVRVGSEEFVVNASAQPGQAALIVVRPEHIQIEAGQRAQMQPDANAILGTIINETFLGAEVMYDVETALGHVRVRRTSGPIVGAEGREEVTLTFDQGRMRLFEGKNT